MAFDSVFDPIDYLMIGHITHDLIPGGYTLGGTASYSSKAAQALGQRVGIVTACAEGAWRDELQGIAIAAFPSAFTTTYENIQTPTGRIQYLHHRADELNLSMVPEEWRSAPIVHLGPVANEIDPNLSRAFPNSTLGLTPQGWMRAWNADKRVYFSSWPESGLVMGNADAAVLSIEDIRGDESYVDLFASQVPVLVITESAAGARVYWNGDVRRFRAPVMEEVDPTGAGDIFAAAFFVRLRATRNPWEAARFAVHVASYSVLRKGLAGVPTRDEIYSAMVEVLDAPLDGEG